MGNTSDGLGPSSRWTASGGGDSLFRRLVSSALSTSTAPYDDGQRGRQRREEQQQRPPPPRRKSKKMALHAVPLMPSHAVAHRRRMELIERELPIPVGLREGREYDYDDNGVTKTRTTRRRRRRAYDAMPAENSHRSLEGGGGEADDTYEIGALYQGYGTHYIDLYVGSPIPQRQTVIVDTGSSVTSFPCTGCRDCGSISDNRAVGGAIDDVGPFHTDDVFRKGESDTYMEKACRIGGNAMRCDFGQCVSNNRNNNRMGRCEVTVSYAEGSSWTALEGEDLVRPDVPQDDVAGIEQRRMSDVGEGADVTGEDGDDGVGGTSTTYDWSDFRLKFGCQKKVTGLFRTQLEDGIMGMDNRNGAFWLQLREHYERMGYGGGNVDEVGETEEEDEEEEGASFDPSRFSLCYSRRPLSLDLRSGVESGALTLGGSDPLWHDTPMVYASNVTPQGGWYNVRITAMFLRTNGWSSSIPGDDAISTTVYDPIAGARYLRVRSSEDDLNGGMAGVIVDSGTTDTYLPFAIDAHFQKTWKEATGFGYDNEPSLMTPEEVRSLPTILVVMRGHVESNAVNIANDAVGMTRAHAGMFEPEGNASDDVDPVSDVDVVVAIPPEHYMEESSRSPGTYTSRVYFTERRYAQSILGSNFLMGHEVLFDNGLGRIGFAESHCDYSRYMEEKRDSVRRH